MKDYAFGAFILIILLLMLDACLQTHPETPICDSPISEVATRESQNHLMPSIRRLAIATDSIYYKQFDYDHTGQESLLILFNEKNLSLEIYDLGSSSRLWSRKITDYGVTYPEQGFVNGLDFIDFDSIFLASGEWIWLIDTQKVVTKVAIPEITYHHKRLKLFNLDHAPLRYDSCSKTILFQSYTPSLSVTSDGFFTFPVTAGLRLQDGQVTPYAMTFPEMYEEDYYGFANMTFRTIEGCSSFYSFPADSRFYILDHPSNSISMQCGKSSYDDGSINIVQRKYKSDTEHKLNAMIRMPFYLNILSDPDRNRYYRFFLTPLSEKKPSGDFNTWADKELILMVFDDTFQLNNEYSLGVDQYSYYRSFVGKEGLFLARHSTSQSVGGDTQLVFDILE